VDGFTESGSFTSLGFGSQTRDSTVGQLGYRASFKSGLLEPFAQATWNHEFDSTDRNVTASLTTIVAPSFSMPAVILGKDWSTATLGTVIDSGNGVKVIGSVSAEFAQSNASTYGGQLGLNVSF
jgi:outer membrane lipase/esterase